MSSTLPDGAPDLGRDIEQFGGHRQTFPASDFLAVDEPMRRFVRETTRGVARPRERLKRLTDALFAPDRFSLHYDASLSLTAAQTFHRRGGNCLSTTALLVALAREAGMKAVFQDVDEWPRIRLDDSLWIHDRHVNAVVRVGQKEWVTVDFNLRAEGLETAELIDDASAAAQFFSNLGATAMQQGELALAHANFRRALTLDPHLAYVWNNAGVLYWRAGLLDRAEEIFIYAIRVDAGEVRAMSNLARLYRQTDRLDEASALEQQLQAARRRNPYYFYALADRAYRSQDFEQTTAYLQRAISLKSDEPAFHELLRKAESRTGNGEDR